MFHTINIPQSELKFKNKILNKKEIIKRINKIVSSDKDAMVVIQARLLLSEYPPILKKNQPPEIPYNNIFDIPMNNQEGNLSQSLSYCKSSGYYKNCVYFDFKSAYPTIMLEIFDMPFLTLITEAKEESEGKVKEAAKALSVVLYGNLSKSDRKLVTSRHIAKLMKLIQSVNLKPIMINADGYLAHTKHTSPSTREPFQFSGATITVEFWEHNYIINGNDSLQINGEQVKRRGKHFKIGAVKYHIGKSLESYVMGGSKLKPLASFLYASLTKITSIEKTAKYLKGRGIDNEAVTNFVSKYIYCVEDSLYLELGTSVYQIQKNGNNTKEAQIGTTIKPLVLQMHEGVDTIAVESFSNACSLLDAGYNAIVIFGSSWNKLRGLSYTAVWPDRDGVSGARAFCYKNKKKCIQFPEELQEENKNLDINDLASTPATIKVLAKSKQVEYTPTEIVKYEKVSNEYSDDPGIDELINWNMDVLYDAVNKANQGSLDFDGNRVTAKIVEVEKENNKHDLKATFSLCRWCLENGGKKKNFLIYLNMVTGIPNCYCASPTHQEFYRKNPAKLVYPMVGCEELAFNSEYLHFNKKGEVAKRNKGKVSIDNSLDSITLQQIQEKPTTTIQRVPSSTFLGAVSEKFSLIQAPTGSGKTHFEIEYLSNLAIGALNRVELYKDFSSLWSSCLTEPSFLWVNYEPTAKDDFCTDKKGNLIHPYTFDGRPITPTAKGFDVQVMKEAGSYRTAVEANENIEELQRVLGDSLCTIKLDNAKVKENLEDIFQSVIKKRPEFRKYKYLFVSHTSNSSLCNREIMRSLLVVSNSSYFGWNGDSSLIYSSCIPLVDNRIVCIDEMGLFLSSLKIFISKDFHVSLDHTSMLGHVTESCNKSSPSGCVGCYFLKKKYQHGFENDRLSFGGKFERSLGLQFNSKLNIDYYDSTKLDREGFTQLVGTTIFAKRLEKKAKLDIDDNIFLPADENSKVDFLNCRAGGWLQDYNMKLSYMMNPTEYFQSCKDLKTGKCVDRDFMRAWQFGLNAIKGSNKSHTLKLKNAYRKNNPVYRPQCPCDSVVTTGFNILPLNIFREHAKKLIMLSAPYSEINLECLKFVGLPSVPDKIEAVSVAKFRVQLIKDKRELSTKNIATILNVL